MACDASTVVLRHAPDGTVLDVGRKRRTIPPAIRRALTARDRHCQFPGCTARHCEAHHLEHWADGGATRLTNLALLCRRHHRAVHEEGFTLTRTPDGAVHVCRPDGR
ncbi:MAG: HNH endonuclease signature motif containing protein, partial [Dehalococcoidia bacterium]